MNYTELAAIAPSQPWAARHKREIDMQNEAILAERQAKLDAVQGIRVGDIVLDGEATLRVAHHWGDSIQLTDGRFGASFYLGDGYVEFSGGLNPGLPIERFEPTAETRTTPVWFFSQNHATAHNGYHTNATFRVWKLG